MQVRAAGQRARNPEPNVRQQGSRPLLLRIPNGQANRGLVAAGKGDPLGVGFRLLVAATDHDALVGTAALRSTGPRGAGVLGALAKNVDGKDVLVVRKEHVGVIEGAFA